MKRDKGTMDGQAAHREMWKEDCPVDTLPYSPQVLNNMHSHHRLGMVEFLMEAAEGVIIAVSDSTQSSN